MRYIRRSTGKYKGTNLYAKFRRLYLKQSVTPFFSTWETSTFKLNADEANGVLTYDVMTNIVI